MDDVQRALEKAAMPTFKEYVEHGNCKDWNKIARAAVLAFLKDLCGGDTTTRLDIWPIVDAIEEMQS